MESFQKRERDRRKRQKRQDKVERRKERTEAKKQRPEDGATNSPESNPDPTATAVPVERPAEGSTP
jgi:hypothetical protein